MNTFVSVIGFSFCALQVVVSVRDLHKRSMERLYNEYDDEESELHEHIIMDLYGAGIMVFAIVYEGVKGLVRKFAKEPQEWNGYGDDMPKVKLGAFEMDI